MKQILFCGICIVSWIANVTAQKAVNNKNEIDELRLKLNDDGSHYLKFTVLGQLWFRYNESNPGTTVLREPSSETFDIGIRRLRFQFFGQLTDHAFFYLHFGQDNFNFLSPRKFTPFIQDALAEYKVKKGNEGFIFGGGLSILSGLSRFTQPQLPNIMSTDIPIFTLPTFDITDQAGRKLSIYARGQVGKLDYRVALSNPFPVTTSGLIVPPGNTVSPYSNYSPQGNHLQYNGLFIWNFFEREPHVVAFMPGTYYGKKKVFNVESGFIIQKNAMWSSPDSGQTVNYHNLVCWSASVFLDMPMDSIKGSAFNAYVGYFNSDFGPRYLRYVGVMNPADGLSSTTKYSVGSQGNALPMYGTGNIIYAQFGYLFKRTLLGKNSGTIMPYFTFQTAKYDRLPKQMTLYNFGINWFLKANTSKVSLDFQNRPVYTLIGNMLVRSPLRKSQLVLQYQFFL